MRYAFLADIHANEDALRRVLRDARARGAETFVCLGDIVGYGPRPSETLAIVRSDCTFTVRGNHDAAVGSEKGEENFAPLASEAVARHRAALSGEDREGLANLPLVGSGEGFAVAHGDFTEPGAFKYVETEDDARANFAARSEPLLLVGHTHTPALFVTGDSGRVYALEPQDFEIEAGKRYLINPGSVGYPRATSGVCFSSYVIYDSELATVTFHRVPFAVSSVLERGGRRIFPAARLTPTHILLGALAGVLLLTLAALIGFGPRRATVQTSIPKPFPAERPSAASGEVLATRTCAITNGLTAVYANFCVETGDFSVILRVTFVDAHGKVLRTLCLKPQRSSHRKFKVPAGSARVIFDLLNVLGNPPSRIRSFQPEARPR